MEFDEVIRKRRSIRNFKSTPLPLGALEQLLEAARLAPSGLNLQPWRFVAVEDAILREKIATTTLSSFITNAPLLLLCGMDTHAFDNVGERINELASTDAFSSFANPPYMKNHVEDLSAEYKRGSLIYYTALSISHIVLKATDMGLGCLIVGAFDGEKIKEAAELPETFDILSIVAIGFSTKDVPARPRLPLETILLKRI